MSRLLLVISIVLIWSGPSVCVGQTKKPDSTELLKQLLAMPAPTPRGSPTPKGPDLKMGQPGFFDRKNPPPDDAPIQDLINYWNSWSRRNQGHKPSKTVTQRIVDYALGKPERLPMYLHMVPANETNIAKIKELYDKEQNEQQLDSGWSQHVKEWLLFKSNHFLDELAALARKVKDSAKGGNLNKQEALVALASLDWSNAEPVLRTLLASAQPRSSTLALSLFYQHAIEEKDAGAEDNYRRQLQQIVADRNQPGHARNIAVEALSMTEWSGRDEWYLSLFTDETLIKLEDGDFVYAPLSKLFAWDPDKWIPAMARLLESKDLTVRTVAASCLLIFQPQDVSKEALLPVLPWLSNPSWIGEAAGERTRLIQTMSAGEIPESVPGLIWIVENEKENKLNRSYAAQSLSAYKDPRAAPALKRALADEKDEGNRHRLIHGMVSCRGLGDTEGVQALEAYLAKVSTPEGRAQMNPYHSDHSFELPVSIGRYLSQMPEAYDSLVRAVLARAESVKSENPALAQDLLRIAHRWQGRQVDADLIDRIANGSADANLIAAALTRRATMIEKLRPELEGLAAAEGIAPAVGAVMLDDSILVQSVLTSGDQPRQIALLACSRLTQTSLPIDLVGPFLRHKNSMLANAAELYLLADDSHEARELLWQHHPNEAFVTGWREKVPEAFEGAIDAIHKMEDKLRAELFKDDGPIEILALLSHEVPISTVLRIYPNKAVYTDYEDSSRYRERTVSKTEVSTFRDYVTTSGLLDLGPDLDFCHHGCVPQQFLAITKEKGRRVYSQQGFLGSMPFPHNFTQLGDDAKTHYNLENEIKGLEVLFADPELAAIDVWQHENGQLRLFVERPEEEMEEPELPEESDEEEEPTKAMIMEARRRQIAAERALLSWRVFANGELGDVASQPDVYTIVDPVKFFSQEDDDAVMFDEAQLLTPNSIIIARGNEGLWKEFAGGKRVRLGAETGGYGTPIVTGDHKWLVVGKTDGEWSEPNHIVRLNLQTGREFRINIEPADDFKPVKIPNVNKILLRRAKAEHASEPVGPDRPEFYLLEPATGQVRLVSGTFEPLLQARYRPLQRTEKPDEYWAAIPDENKNQTQLGRYNVRDFSFKPVIVVPHIAFDSMSMWVDATNGKVYVVYKGQLLRLPLQTASK